MEAAGFIEKVTEQRALSFHFEETRKLPPPIIAFNEVSFAYSGNMKDCLYKDISFGIEYVVTLYLK
jgi:ATP-binding cassette subfamily F protein 2